METVAVAVFGGSLEEQACSLGDTV